MSIFEALKTAITTAQEILARRSDAQANAFETVLDCCRQSRAILFSTHRIGMRDSKLENELCEIWANAAAKMMPVDPTLAEACHQISCYWTDPFCDPVRDYEDLYWLFGQLKWTCSSDAVNRVISSIRINKSLRQPKRHAVNLNI